MRGIDDLESVYGTSSFLGMTFYFGATYSTPEGNARASWYGFSATPSVMIGGTADFIGGMGSGSMYSSYNPTVQSQMAVASPLIMASSYVLDGDVINLSLQIDVDMSVIGSNNELHFFICQEDLHGQSNMVVDMLPSEPFTLTTPGQSLNIERSFTMDPAWNEPDLRVIMVVQDMTSKVIHQATQSTPNYAAQVTVNAEPDGVVAPWRLTGPGLDINQAGDYAINLWDVGSYTLTWEDIPYWTSPAVNPETQVVAEGGTLLFEGVYTNGPFAHTTAGAIGNTNTGQAVSMVDVDNDGDLDLHVVNNDAADQLLRNDGDGTFTDIATGAIAETGASMGAGWADADGDGNLDVVLTRNNATDLILTGDGSGGFTPAGTFGMDLAGPGTSVNWLDFNLDGLMDLYIVNNGEDNILLKSIGIFGGTYYFASEPGDQSNLGNGSAGCWTDGDLDGRMDLFVANQFNANAMLQNTAIGFSDISNTCGMGENLGKAMGAAWGDYDNDGDFDLYVANDGMADLLYRCTGSLQYTQMAGDNLGDRGDARGVAWVDLNNDTFLDLYVVRNNDNDLLLLGDGAGGFLRVPVGPVEAAGPGNGLACGDLDDDGDVDLFVTREGATNVLFNNQFDEGNRWIKLHLTGAGTNTSAIGARVVLSAGGVTQSRLITPGSGYLCNNALGPHFGLGTSTIVDQIDIYWPDGTHQIVGQAASNQTLAIIQGEDPAAPVDNVIPTRVTTLGLAHPNPFNPSTTIEFALGKADKARLDVFTVDGRHVRTLIDRGLEAGPHAATWNGLDNLGHSVASGSYFYRLTTSSGFSEAGRMVLVK